MVVFLLLFTAITVTVIGELLLKLGVDRVGSFGLSFDVLWKTFTEWRVVLGFVLIFIGSLFWLGVISRTDFSFAYPMLALSYVVSLIPARYILGEEVTPNRIIGACVVVVGVIIISWRGQ